MVIPISFAKAVRDNSVTSQIKWMKVFLIVLIFGELILLVAAFVVYNGITVRIRHKHFCDEQVNLHIAAVQAYSQITAPIVKRL